jgi:hypothetical protein
MKKENYCFQFNFNHQRSIIAKFFSLYALLRFHHVVWEKLIRTNIVRFKKTELNLKGIK